jgi:hypothetical protein
LYIIQFILKGSVQMSTKISIFRIFSVLLIFVFMLASAGMAYADVAAMPNLAPISIVLTPGRAIATWPSGVPAGEKRPVVVFLPGWGGIGAVDASVSGQNTNLVNEGYVTLAIGFDSAAEWTSDIDVKTAEGLDKLCADASIPANCDAIILDGESYGGSQNYFVIEYVRSHGYSGGTGTVLGFVSEDAGYAAPGNLIDPVTGEFQRTGLADTASYGVAMIQNLGDTTFPVDDCTWGNCGVRTLSDAHQAQGDTNVFSICPPGGEHGTRGYADWDAWVVSAIKTLFHTVYGVPTFTGYTGPTISVANTCLSSSSTTFVDVPATHPLYKYIQALYDAGYTAGCSTSPMMFCPDTILDRAQSAVFMLRGQLGSGYTPPPAPWTNFVNESWVGFEWAQGWAEGMYIEGLTSGCQTSPLMFCPANQLPRVEASIFGLKMKYGVSYLPPPASGTLFADFPPSDPSYWGIDWAEQAYLDGLLPACGTDSSTGKPMFCPGELVNRGWGAYLIVKAKNLPTP